MLKTVRFSLQDVPFLAENLVEFARNFDFACILNSHKDRREFPIDHSEFDLLAGFSNIHPNSEIVSDFNNIDELNKQQGKWYFGYLSYDLKNRFENLRSDLPDLMHWPELYFIVPDILIFKKDNEVYFSFNDELFTDSIFNELIKQPENNYHTTQSIDLAAGMTKEEYIQSVENIKKHIIRGDIYEVNFCQEFFAYQSIDPFHIFLSLTEKSPSPFSSFLKINEKYLLSASPERYLKKKGNLLISQPIKGTIKRSDKPDEDTRLKNSLETNTKERSENIMIVDLVRNDLSKIARKGTVHVDELCEIYSFPQVHQLISTISAQCNTTSLKEILKATFPMGSMTGAPKIEALKLIEKYERVKRGIYSGSVGYLNPSGDFDFNVVIRSIQYNADNNYVSYLAGSAITSLSDPEEEYQECILKTYAIKEAFK